MEQLGPHWTDFHENRYLSIFKKSVEKIQDSLKHDKNNVTVREDKFTFMIYVASVLLRMKTFSVLFRKESQNTNFVCFLFFENLNVYKKM
jgi:hypothetical protein